ncbi:A-kinase-interacting protein 1 isoform 1-T1 [Aulostomus maculatus]
MAKQTWLESSLRRSACLGREVLERASRRSVDWTTSAASQTSTVTDEGIQTPVKKPHTELDDAFGTIAEFMTQTTYQCRRFYESGCCSEPSDPERKHVSRFHKRPAAGRTTSAQPPKKHVSTSPPRRPAGLDALTNGRAPAPCEDFHIEVSPGTYAITASLPEAQQQTQVVNIGAGESIDLTFNL